MMPLVEFIVPYLRLKMIRRIDKSDIPEIHSICSHYIRNTTVTFGEEVPSLTGFGLVIQILHFNKKHLL